MEKTARPNQTSPPRPDFAVATERQLRSALPRFNLASLFDEGPKQTNSVCLNRRLSDKGVKSYPSRNRIKTSPSHFLSAA